MNGSSCHGAPTREVIPYFDHSCVWLRLLSGESPRFAYFASRPLICIIIIRISPSCRFWGGQQSYPFRILLY